MKGNPGGCPVPLYEHMFIIPAIDLRAGRTVRLLRGNFAQEMVYSDDPVAVARCWIAAARLIGVRRASCETPCLVPRGHRERHAAD